jgi:acetylornithine/N-succinyldiaminopimelate aminotransferase
MQTESWIKRSDRVFMQTYSRFPVVMTEGQGAILKDETGRSYLDFLSGIAVCSLGHNHPAVTQAICRQAAKLLHVSNLYYTIPQTELAEMLVAGSFADRVFFANSGAEANEAAIKLARKYSASGRYEIISLQGSFHGRTLATVAATGQPKFHQGFEPLPAGFTSVPFGEMQALEEAVSPRTSAVLVEPLQGEGGVRPLSGEYLGAIRKLCDRHDLLLIFDEVQVGMGRTGSLFAYQQLGVVPDIMTLAKALGNGLPIGAMLATEKVAAAFAPGSHASTFGGNPVACAAAVATMRIMMENGFLQGVKERGLYLAERLEEVRQKFPEMVEAVRGMGLIQGLVLTENHRDLGAKIVQHLFEAGVLANFAGNTALRFLPPLIITREEIDTMIEHLLKVLDRLGK